ncbi:MAG TPA: Gfo/Idh/MocA family oxidoreductase [Flavisolibacter sp.]|jgi:predicted dehydrogenase|nr:Gfo/Idh/MocA family oxidoreductase [Flavisolibacter sp.]
MENQTINWGIIGCGDVTEVKSGPAFNKVPDSKLVAVMRRNEEKAKDYAQRHGVGKWYSNADDLINDPEVNAIYIATPPLNHEEYAIKAMQAGKPVYVEKPMALNAAAAEQIENVAKQTGVKITVAHYRRQQPLFLKVKKLIEQKAIGEVRFVDLKMLQPHQSEIITKTETNWRIDPSVSGGGLFYDLAPHQIDLMMYFFGKPKKISGIAFNSSHFYKADDITCGQILFDSGVVFNGSWCFTVEERKDLCEIIGSEGKLSFPIFDHKQLILEKQGTKTTFEFNNLQHLQQPMIQKVVEYFLDRSPNPCSPSEGVDVMKMMDALAEK